MPAKKSPRPADAAPAKWSNSSLRATCAMFAALYDSDPVAVKMAWSKNPRPSTDEEGQSFATAAARWARDDAAKVFLEQAKALGVDLDAPDAKGRVASHVAARKGRRGVLELFLQAGADPKSQDDQGHPLAYWVARDGDVARLKLLGELGADFSARSPTGWTPLMAACSEMEDEAALFLAQNGADALAQAQDGMGAPQLAAIWGCPQALEAMLERLAPWSAALMALREAMRKELPFSGDLGERLARGRQSCLALLERAELDEDTRAAPSKSARL